jgi:hypothetical protein
MITTVRTTATVLIITALAVVGIALGETGHPGASVVFLDLAVVNALVLWALR